jgi:hypothetical protein
MSAPSLPPDATLDDWVEAVVATAPPMTAELAERLRAVLSETVHAMPAPRPEPVPNRKAA